MPFFLPQSLAKPSIHLSYWGMKWLHCKIFKVLLSASAVETNGAATGRPRPAAPAARAAVFRNCRRVAVAGCFLLDYDIIHSLESPWRAPKTGDLTDTARLLMLRTSRRTPVRALIRVIACNQVGMEKVSRVVAGRRVGCASRNCRGICQFSRRQARFGVLLRRCVPGGRQRDGRRTNGVAGDLPCDNPRRPRRRELGGRTAVGRAAPPQWRCSMAMPGHGPNAREPRTPAYARILT